MSLRHRAIVVAGRIDDATLRSIVERLELDRFYLHAWGPIGRTLFGLGRFIEITIHTWPERSMISVDLLGDPGTIDRIGAAVEAHLGGERVEHEDFAR